MAARVHNRGMLRRLLASFLALSIPFSSNPAWAAGGVIAAPVETGAAAGPVAATPGVNVSGGVKGAPASPGSRPASKTAVVVTASPVNARPVFRTPLSLRPQGSGWFSGLLSRAGPSTSLRAGNGVAAPSSKLSYDYARLFDLSRRMLSR